MGDLTSPAPRLSAPVIGATLLLVALFAGDQISRKILLGDITPLWSGALAYTLAAIGLWIHSAIGGVGARPGDRLEWRRHTVSGVLFVLVNAVGLFGVQLTLASRAGIFIFTYPLFVALFGSLGAKGEPVTRQGIAGMAVAFGGVVYVLQDRLAGDGASLLGDGLILTSAALLGMLIVHVRDVSRAYGARPAILWQLTLGLPWFWGAALVFEPAPSAWSQASTLALLYQAFGINLIGFLGRAVLIERYNASTISSFFFITPVLAVIFAWLLLGEPMTGGMVLGGVIVGVGVLIVIRGDAPSR